MQFSLPQIAWQINSNECLWFLFTPDRFAAWREFACRVEMCRRLFLGGGGGACFFLLAWFSGWEKHGYCMKTCRIHHLDSCHITSYQDQCTAHSSAMYVRVAKVCPPLEQTGHQLLKGQMIRFTAPLNPFVFTFRLICSVRLEISVFSASAPAIWLLGHKGWCTPHRSALYIRAPRDSLPQEQMQHWLPRG